MNLKDHLIIALQYEVGGDGDGANDASLEPLKTWGLQRMMAIARYVFRGDGPLGSNTIEATVFGNSRLDKNEKANDFQIMIMPGLLGKVRDHADCFHDHDHHRSQPGYLNGMQRQPFDNERSMG